MAAGAAGVDGVLGARHEQRLGDLRPGAVAGAQEQDPDGPATGRTRRCGHWWDEPGPGVELLAGRGEQVLVLAQFRPVVHVSTVS